MNKINKMITAVLTVCLSCFLFSSCNEDLTDPLRKDYPENGSAYHKGNVLWIVVDGASGTAFKTANNDRRMPVLRKMLQNSLYTFNGLADTRPDTIVSDTLGWDNLLTASERHTAGTPSVFQRMKEANPDNHIYLYATTGYFYNIGKKGTDMSSISKSDDEAVSSVVTSLSKESAPDLTVIELNDVQRAGEQYGFSQKTGTTAGEPTDEVITALSNIDSYISRIMETLKKRPAYNKENWLVIVTSNYGGERDNSAETVFEMKDRNTFTMMYNDKFSATLQLPPASDYQMAYKYFTPRYSSLQDDYAKVNDPRLFDFKFDPESKDTTSWTVQFMFNSVKDSKKGVSLISKSVIASPKYTQGWTVVRSKGNILPKVDGSRWSSENALSNVSDGDWHVCTLVFDYKKQQFRQYTDGKPTNHGGKEYTSLTRSVGTDSLAALTIGKIFNSTTANDVFYLTELQIYDIALPADYIADNYKLTSLDQLDDFIYWDHLAGYWPSDREEDYKLRILKDYSKYGSVYNGINAGKSDMTLSYSITWSQGTATSENIQPAISRSYYQQTINVIDIPYQTFQWLGLDVSSTWGWNGIARTLPYSDLNSNN